ncbi:hypothetical protein RGCCGE502_33251 (plasmid) [Rhizobium grahamii CCGE 502]|uniref:Uncharacterized protein n=1 Tax=Rhizobium grahamii CCGE 502 TaxID=990285 RepID=S3H3M5_9HYPH|nr:hypothetical protein RGCCGE502_33251 [Rhizobium grahamii CCGE 502]
MTDHPFYQIGAKRAAASVPLKVRLHKWLSWLRDGAAQLGSAYCVYGADDLGVKATRRLANVAGRLGEAENSGRARRSC